jgi:hypothetical protein
LRSAAPHLIDRRANLVQVSVSPAKKILETLHHLSQIDQVNGNVGQTNEGSVLFNRVSKRFGMGI